MIAVFERVGGIGVSQSENMVTCSDSHVIGLSRVNISFARTLASKVLIPLLFLSEGFPIYPPSYSRTLRIPSFPRQLIMLRYWSPLASSEWQNHWLPTELDGRKKVLFLQMISFLVHTYVMKWHCKSLGALSSCMLVTYWKISFLSIMMSGENFFYRQNYTEES